MKSGRCGLALLAGLALLGASACDHGGGGDDPPDFGTNDPELILALGDSITYGVGDFNVTDCNFSRDTAGYPVRLAGLIGKNVLNAGQCGATSFDGAAEIDYVLQRFRPGVLLIDFSPNDIFHDMDDIVANLRTMITAAKKQKTVPVIGTLVPAAGVHSGWEPFIEALNGEIHKLAQQEQIQCADLWAAFKADPGFDANPTGTLLSVDGLHPSAAGYDVMAKTWHDTLKNVY